MLLFRSEEEVNQWCAQTGEARGEILTLSQVWQLARLWYFNRTRLDFHGRSAAEIEAIFAQMGLTGSFWQFART